MRLLKADRAGFVARRTASDEWVQAIRKALAGGRYRSGSLAEKQHLFGYGNQTG